MNANELAKIQAFKTEELTMWERNHTATMLRQQQAEIEALKQSKYDDNNKVNNEPVAWMDKETGCFVYSQYDYEDLDEHGKDGLIPLYTHPVKELTLTDDEIEMLAHKYNLLDDFSHEFVRACLRKAQEK